MINKITWVLIGLLGLVLLYEAFVLQENRENRRLREIHNDMRAFRDFFAGELVTHYQKDGRWPHPPPVMTVSQPNMAVNLRVASSTSGSFIVLVAPGGRRDEYLVDPTRLVYLLESHDVIAADLNEDKIDRAAQLAKLIRDGNIGPSKYLGPSEVNLEAAAMLTNASAAPLRWKVHDPTPDDTESVLSVLESLTYHGSRGLRSRGNGVLIGLEDGTVLRTATTVW